MNFVKSNPTISIIIPVYNQAKELKMCLKSILKQTFKDFEVIVVDDGSTVPLGTEISNLKSFRISHCGAAAARNFGFKKSRGKFILFCDADLVLRPEMLEKMYQALQENPRASYSYSRFKYGFKKFKLWPFDPKKLRQMPYIHTTSLIRRERFPGFDEKIERLQDWDLWLMMLKKGYLGIWIPKVLFKVKPGGTISMWLPKLAYKIPWQKFGLKIKTIEKYKEAAKIIKEKHHLNF